MAQVQGSSIGEETLLSRSLSDTVHGKVKWLQQTFHADHDCATTAENQLGIQNIVEDLKTILVRWLKIIQEQCTKNTSEISASRTDSNADFGLRLEIFGGHLLGVTSEGSDVDLVCVVPGFVKRSDFFAKFPNFIRENSNFEHIRVVSGARIPLIECHSNNIKLDVLLCIIQNCDIVPGNLDLLDDDNCLGLMDTTSMYSVNGYRETMAVLQIVPDKDVFVLVLKTVKLWAKCQHIHHGNFGFLGGFAWTLLVAYICLNHRGCSVDQILYKFFVTFSNWELRKAVHLTPLEKEDKLKLKPWNPLNNHGDSLHEWPIITPIYPAHNAAFCVSPFTFKIMKSLLGKAAVITEKVLSLQATWEELFQVHFNMFNHYKHFLIISAWASNVKDTYDWLGLLESQLRVLFLNLSKANGIKLIHPYTEKLSPLNPRSVHEICWAAGLKVDMSHGNLDITKDIEDFKIKVISLAKTRDIYKEGMVFDIRYIKRSNLFETLDEKIVGSLG